MKTVTATTTATNDDGADAAATDAGDDLMLLAQAAHAGEVTALAPLLDTLKERGDRRWLTLHRACGRLLRHAEAVRLLDQTGDEAVGQGMQPEWRDADHDHAVERALFGLRRDLEELFWAELHPTGGMLGALRDAASLLVLRGSTANGQMPDEGPDDAA